MIDHIALALGHGLMVVALLRLFMRDALDADPLIEGIKAEDAARRKAARTAARNHARQQPDDGRGAD
jgi:hypothetical protein